MSFYELINQPIIEGNSLWRFGLMGIVIVVVMVTGKIAGYCLASFSNRKIKKNPDAVSALFIRALAKPLTVAFFTVAIELSRFTLIFDNPKTDAIEGIRFVFYAGWGKLIQAMWAITMAYALYRLVDVIEHYMYKIVRKTETKLDDMLVPVVRKSMRITIAIVAALLIAENIFGAEHIKSLILSAGVGGIAIALAARDTIANFFGSITIFADRPFQIEELVNIAGQMGFVEEVGFRSTRLRTLNGHQIVIPNSTVANSQIENIGRRPFIRKNFNITITYDSGYDKTKKAVETIKDILGKVEQLNNLPDKRPRVYFNEFDSSSLNIYISYWFSPADYWQYMEVSEQINFEILRAFDQLGIDFAFPTQTLYVKKTDERAD